MATSNKRGGKTGKAGRSTPVSNFLDAIAPSGEAVTGTDWTEAHPDNISKVVQLVSLAGGATMFGRSRDGASLSIALFFGEDKRTVWIGPEKEPDEELVKIITLLEGLVD